ncbi:uncharacterized protein LOC107611555 [Arachis ipaensis]|uniref:uncharacterized protein LOC107611555 n=1 Tax=Arachis ipaensis TaxID=130454 RepID=UPI0007AFAFB3|nr:uncharacterized protein LOC107611555 [Arachis ipaensis]
MLEIFYDGLSEMSKMALDHSAGGSLHMKKMPEEAQDLIDIVANNQYMYISERNPSSAAYSPETAYEVDTSDNAWITMEEVNYMENSSRNSNNNPYSNIFNQGWRNHPNFGWRDQQKPQQGFNNNQGGMNQNRDTGRSAKQKDPEILSNTLPSNTEVNSKEECKALTMGAEAEPKEEPATEELKEIKAQEETESVTMNVPMKLEEPEDQPSPNVQQDPEDEELAQFLAVLRKLQVNISFAKVLEKNPPSMACLRSLISDKKALREDETVVLTKDYSALVQKKLPQKLPDPCGTITFEKALCDLGSSINLMPLSMMRKLGIQEVQPAKISLEMTDKSLKWAYGMVENVLVKVENLYLPADCMILDTGEDRDDSIILGRSFLATAKALTDVKIGELVLRLHEDHILFKIPNPHSPSDKVGTTVQHLVFQARTCDVQARTIPGM